MSLLETASLIVTPNGYKEGKLYSVIPSDGSGDMSVTRATTATRVNSQGLVELVPYNLVTYSNDFSSSWALFQSTTTSGQADPFGGNNAIKLKYNTSSAYHSITQGLLRCFKRHFLPLVFWQRLNSLLLFVANAHCPPITQAHDCNLGKVAHELFL